MYFLFLLLISLHAQAQDLFSAWRGSGYVHIRVEDQHEDQDCQDVNVQISRTANSFNYYSSFRCGPRYEYLVPRLPLKIDGQNLLNAEGKIVGMLTENELHIKIYTPKQKINIDAQVNGNQLDLFQHFPYGRTDFKFKAILDLASNL